MGLLEGAKITGIFGANEIAKPYARPGCKSKDKRGKEGPYYCQQGRQWPVIQGADIAGRSDISSDGSFDQDRFREEPIQRTASSLLQGGLGNTRETDSHRSGRKFTLSIGSSGKRPAQRKGVICFGMEGVEVLESGSLREHGLCSSDAETVYYIGALPGFKGRRGAVLEPFARWFFQDRNGKSGVLYRTKDILKARYGAQFFLDAGEAFEGAWWHVPSSTDLKAIYELIA